MENKDNLEEIISQLELLAEDLKSDKLSLDESIKVYEKCKDLYLKASELLEQSKQKVEIFNPLNGTTESFDEY